MSKKPKQRKPKAAGRFSKRSAAGTGSTDDLHPVFCLRYQDRELYASKCKGKDLKSFVALLEKLSRLQWKQIKKIRRESLGYEIISKDALKRPLPSDISPDATILCFRCSNRSRMLGVRRGEKFHIVFVDPKLSVYNH
jgi:hypothetical protein